jgi:hypothetical protein
MCIYLSILSTAQPVLFLLDSIFIIGEKLQNKKIQGLGDKVIVDGEAKKIGAGGLGGGVNLAVSNETIQERNQKMLKKFLKKQRKLMKQREKEAAAEKEESAE